MWICNCGCFMFHLLAEGGIECTACGTIQRGAPHGYAASQLFVTPEDLKALDQVIADELSARPRITYSPPAENTAPCDSDPPPPVA
jgi:hypothetical protein